MNLKSGSPEKRISRSTSGRICSIWNSFDWGNLLQTGLMAVIGAAVSYLTSRLLQGRRRRR